ncbi:M1 family metallopeptidase [Sphingomonas desiccabilis]|uniref:Aminopeptidase N n=1 Tax=Sphingomonas desiccabilis TaxID=429134 RepID=A0A4V1QPZ9_9SPHN|nr:M1 family metallopeptidase [Sphingomonas desiccabilis]MBB3910973.1 aminopeptidase N [Sphingomonas desiccabilis]RXZ35557.1 M1 family peptidase [Sphingomonas desiccabilis]
MRRFLLVSALLAAPAMAAPDAPSPILTTLDARDVLTYARPEIARVTHVDLNLAADFASRTMRGTATLDILARPDAREIVLDDKGLVIARITDGAGKPLKWTVGAEDPYKGAPLTVAIGKARRIVITYSSRPDARALGWLPPELTAGKRKPYLFSQGQAINNRSWIPTQDSPGIRQSWSASITVPDDLVAVMSGERLTPEGEAAGEGLHRFRFRMDRNVPPYLIALAVGDIGFRAVDGRTGVFTEPGQLDRVATELSDTGKMVTTAEALYGAYRWGRFDVLVLPPSFPFGGMENPTLTFATPTIITGDKSNVDVIAHELAHSWSGNLVTNATWSDSWLNEGFTTYFENRIDEALYGKERAATLADLSWDDLQRDLKEAKPEQTRLHGDPEGTYGQLDYTKGSTFLRTIEYAVGRARWDAYLRAYFDRHAFQPQTSANFLKDLRANLIRGDRALEERLQLDAWVYQPGLPSNAVHVKSATLAKIDQILERVNGGAPIASVDAGRWSTQEWLRFLNGLPRQQSATRLAELDQAFRLSTSTNAYIRSAWLVLAIGNRYQPAVASAEQFLPSVGRNLLITPVYRALKAQGEWGVPVARRIFEQARAGYHPVTAGAIAQLLH